MLDFVLVELYYLLAFPQPLQMPIGKCSMIIFRLLSEIKWKALGSLRQTLYREYDSMVLVSYTFETRYAGAHLCCILPR